MDAAMDAAEDAKIRYQGAVYRLENGHWRGPDGHTVHLLTWISDDLRQRGEVDQGISGRALAFAVAHSLGDGARLLD